MSASTVQVAMISVRALLIDLDDTLIFGDKNEVLERLSATAKSLSLKIDRDKLRDICEHRSCMIEMISEIVKDEEVSRERFEEEKIKFDGKFDDLLFLGDKVVDTLDYLKRLNISLAIVSTRTSSAIPRILKEKGILEYFDVIVGREDCREKKPSPEPIESALKKLGFNNKEGVFMVGDKQNEDILSAINAGVGSILIKESIDNDRPLPTYHVKEFKDLKNLCIP